MVALTSAAFINIVLYFVGYHLIGNPHWKEMLAHPFYLLGFLASYASMPFGALKDPTIGVWIGLGNITALVVATVIAGRARLLGSRPAVVLLGYSAFTLLSGLLIASGRMNPDDGTFTGAKAPRYLTMPLANWGAVIMALFWLSGRRRWRLISPLSLTLISIPFLCAMFLKLRVWFNGNAMWFAERQFASISLETDFLDPELARYLYPDPEFVKLALPILRSGRLSFFYKGPESWIGKKVNSRFAESTATDQEGAVTRILPVTGGLEVIGWVDGYRLNRVLFVDDDSASIVGFGQKLGAGFPPILRSEDTPESLAWVGFVNLSFGSRSFSTYVIDRHRRRITRIAGPSIVPTVRSLTASEVGSPIYGVTWRMDSTWSVNGVPPRFDFGSGPPGPFFSSWSGSDKNVGQIFSSSFESPPNNCVVLPVLHGPSVNGLSVRILNADTNEAIAIAPLQNQDWRWRFWRFPVDQQIRHLRVSAQDQGSGWGQWVAIGQPSQCQ
ncbi:MAG: hypothetical protein JOY62_18115 [Acidobacteriaceae bacterium]|nr:hypothetical protein [Acidobacteriaceae bacterium]MBV9781883.1 hypothetical protein [Acidobacteriaceae bacterium]